MNTITLGEPIQRCGCKIWYEEHVHSFKRGPQGPPGIGGPPGDSKPLEWDLLHHNSAGKVHEITENCDCGEIKFKHAHVWTAGPRGYRGRPGLPGNSDPDAILYPVGELTNVPNIVIEDCRWCPDKGNHSHAVLRGTMGHDGRRGPKG